MLTQSPDPQRLKTLINADQIDLKNDAELQAILKAHKISSEEFQKILKITERAPTMAELGVYSAMWSEHCSYKSSRVHLKRFPTAGTKVVVGPGENAGVVELEGELCVAFKMESHNHPSYIEPYQGAATGVGGILRDVFCMGARPIANLNCLRFGQQDHERTSYLLARAVKGIGDYGNCVGVPTVGGSVSFDATYNGNCLVNAMAVGLINRNKIFKGFAAGVGNYVVYVGSATGRDGIHGATMASDSFEQKADRSKTTVQVGDPFAEKLLLEATLEALDKNLVVGIQDMGAAGLTSSSFEMAGRAGNGLYLNLDLVPLRAKNMTAYEIMLSESQERMLMVVDPCNWPALVEVLDRWQLPHAVIGVVTNSGRMQIEARGRLEINLPVSPLTDEAPVYNRELNDVYLSNADSGALEDLQLQLQEDSVFASQLFKKMLKDVGSKKNIYEQFDRHVGARTVLDSDSGGAAVLWIRSDETKDAPYLGLALSAGCNERRVRNNPRIGAAQAVLECAKEIIAAGGLPLAVTDCLNFGSAEDPSVMRQLSDSVDGISDACRQLDTPVVSGNVSLYNATGPENIHPTPMIGMVGKVADIRRVTAARISSAGEYLIFKLSGENDSKSTAKLVASLAAKNAGLPAEEGRIADIDWDAEKNAAKAVSILRSAEIAKYVRSVGDGGLGVSIFKTCSKMLAESHSLEILTSDAGSFFGETGSTYLVCLTEVDVSRAQAILRDINVSLELVAKLYGRKENFGTMPDRSILVKTYFGCFSTTELLKEYNA